MSSKKQPVVRKPARKSPTRAVVRAARTRARRQDSGAIRFGAAPPGEPEEVGDTP